MIQRLLAHAGEHHETAAEASQHATQTGGVTLSSSVLFWMTLIAVPLIILAIGQLLKLQLSTKLLLVSSFLVVFSIVSYQEPGAYSIIALTVGFAIVLVQSLIGLSANE